MAGDRTRLINVYESVREDITRGFYINQNSDRVEFEKMPVMLKDSARLKMPNFIEPDLRVYEDFPNTKIYVENIDFLDKALGYDPKYTALLNPASEYRAGGGVRSGSRALEEIICRRSNLLASLELFTYNSDPGDYKPTLDTYEAIWSPCVNVYRDKEYETLEKPILVNVITAAAIKRPDLTEDGLYTKENEATMMRKIRVVLRIAIESGITTLILPAWGCGAYRNPAYEVARCFDEVFDEPEFKGAFEEICFAILDDHNAHHDFNPDGNFKPFFDRFGGK